MSLFKFQLQVGINRAGVVSLFKFQLQVGIDRVGVVSFFKFQFQVGINTNLGGGGSNGQIFKIT